MKLSAFFFTVLFCFFCSFSYSKGENAPTVKFYGTTYIISEKIDTNLLSQMENAAKEIKEYATVEFVLEGISDNDFEKICSHFPKIERLTIKNCLTNLSPIGKLKNLKSIKFLNVFAKNFSPLSTLKNLENVDILASNMGPDLLWMRDMKKIKSLSLRSEQLVSLIGLPAAPDLKEVTFGNCNLNDLSLIPLSLPQLKSISFINCSLKDLSPLTKLKKISKLDLYGSVVKDFSPLAGCNELRELSICFTKEADYNTLGNLTKIEKIKCGLTSMKDLSWLPSLTNLKELELFDEDIKDYSPLWTSNIEKLTVWNRNGRLLSLSVIGQIPYLKDLTLINFENARDSTSLLSLSSLKTLSIFSYNKNKGEFFDLAASAAWINLEELELADAIVKNEDQLSSCTKLKKITLSGINKREGLSISLRFLENTRELETLTIKESNVTEFDSLSHCQSLQYLSIERMKTYPSLDIIRKLPKLKRLTIPKDAFSKEQVKELSKKIKISLR